MTILRENKMEALSLIFVIILLFSPLQSCDLDGLVYKYN